MSNCFWATIQSVIFSCQRNGDCDVSRWFACCIKSAKAFLSIPTCYSQILFCLHFLRSRVYSTSDFGNAQEVFFSLRPNSKAILTLVINATFLTLKSGGTGFDCSVPTSTRGSRIQTGSKLNLSVIEREIKPRRPQASLSNMLIIRCRSTYYCIMDYCDEMAFVHNWKWISRARFSEDILCFSTQYL